MSTDFNYGKTTIITTGPVRPKDRNVPMNARYRVEKYADIATIPVPAVGELVFVMSDENNDNKQNIYVIKSLKARINCAFSCGSFQISSSFFWSILTKALINLQLE